MTDQKRALLVGSSFSAAPMLFALRKHGVRVAVCGSIESDPCHAYADESYYIDYSDADALLSVVSEGKFDYLVPTCNDYSYMSCAKIAEEFKFPGYDPFEVSVRLHTKDGFRSLTRQLGIPSPKFQETDRHFDVAKTALSYPILVKPVDSFSGRGMTRVANSEELASAVAQARAQSRSGTVVLEEFLQGNLHSHSAFVQGGKIARDFFVDEYCSVYPYQVDCSNHPSFLPEQVKLEVREAMAKLVGACELSDGLLHTQFLAHEDKFWIIETMRRCPGDLYGNLVGLSMNIDYADWFVRPFIGEGLPASEVSADPIPYGRHTISVDAPVNHFSFSHSIPSNEVDIVSLKESGYRLNVAPFDKLGIVFARFEDHATLRDVAPRLRNFVSIKELGS